MEQMDLYNWLEATLKSLPLRMEENYKAIWQKGVIRFKGGHNTPDFVDEVSARLICMALSERQPLLIVLPDHRPYRGALLFATALLIESISCIRKRVRAGQVLYFGSTIGIREHLQQVYVNDLCLASVFPQVRLQRNLNLRKINSKDSKSKMHADGLSAGSLPTVLCIYSPSDPINICQRYEASWFAVDCADETKLRWIKPIIEEARRFSTPLIAWISNPFSSATEDFRSAGGLVISWPMIADTQNIPPLGTSIIDGLRHIFDETRQQTVHPVAIEFPRSEQGNQHLRNAYGALSEVTSRASSLSVSHLTWGAIQISWRYLRTLENLCIPLNLFESEVKDFWGVHSISDISQILEKYLEALSISQPDFYKLLVQVQNYLEEAYKQYEQGEPPLWVALSNLCIEDVPNKTFRFFVFPTSAHKRLFILGLLAYHNITEEDLKQLRIGLVSLRELYDSLVQRVSEEGPTWSLLMGLPTTDLQAEYCLVGLPSWASTLYLDPLLRLVSFHIIIYPYQITTLQRRIVEWETRMYPGVVKFADALASTLKHKCPSINLSPPNPRIVIQDIDKHKIEQPSRLNPRLENITIWEPTSSIEEFTILMRNEIEDNISGILSKVSSRSDNFSDNVAEFFDEVWLIEFSNDEHVLLEINAKINVIFTNNENTKTESRFVSSLRKGDRIVFIHGQHKQSLLDLIISRVYRNPSINLHVRLVEKWQEDLATAYHQRALDSNDFNLDKLFKEMKIRGSKISSPQPLRYWLHGETLRPADQEDLRRLADILGLDFVSQHYKRIHQAGSRLAGLHVSLSRRLNAWLNSEAPDIVANVVSQEDIIDEQLGLTFQDFHDSLSILEVRSVRKEKGLFGRDMLGQLEKGRDH